MNLDIEKNKLSVNGKVYLADEIARINIFASFQYFNDMVGVTALPYNDYYYYLEICIDNGEKIYLNSLIDYKIDKIIKDNFNKIEVVNIPTVFPYY